MEKILLTALAVLAALPAVFAQSTVSGISDISFWTGNGTNRAALVMQFGGTESPAAVAWGYRWTGNTTLQEMMSTIDAADARLALTITTFSFGAFLDYASYDQAGLGGTWTNATRTMPGWDGTNWNTLYLAAPQANWPPTGFGLAVVGMSDIPVSNNGWYGWVHSDGPGTYPFAQPAAAVPEPSSLLLLGAACTALLAARKIRRRV